MSDRGSNLSDELFLCFHYLYKDYSETPKADDRLEGFFSAGGLRILLALGFEIDELFEAVALETFGDHVEAEVVVELADIHGEDLVSIQFEHFSDHSEDHEFSF